MKKKIMILGSGTAGLITAAIIQSQWGDKVDIDLFYNPEQKNIAVGESTTPIIQKLLFLINVSWQEFMQNVSSSIKLGIKFKNWTGEGSQYFHGFTGIGFQKYPSTYVQTSSAAYSILNDCYNGSILYDKATNEIPSLDPSRFVHAFHLDTKELSNFLENKFKDKINFVGDKATKVHVNNGMIESVDFEKTGNVTADFYIDCSGFSAVLLKELNPEWVDISNILTVDKAIPQQIPCLFDEVPSYTLSEATKNGWIWEIPIRNRYGTGYSYSSQFTTDEEAREDYNAWLQQRHGVELQTDRVIHYRPGYYKDFWIGNCMSIGLSSGFVEPLESTGIQIILEQIGYLIKIEGPLLQNLNHTRKIANQNNLNLYQNIIDFICLHYDTNRTDSLFWNYMTHHKSDWMLDFEDLCKNNFLDILNFPQGNELFSMESYVAVSCGLNLFTKEGIKNYLRNQSNPEYFISELKKRYDEEVEIKQVVQSQSVSHKQLLNSIAL